MKTSIKIINETGKEGLALIKFIPETTGESSLLKRAVELTYQEEDHEEIDRYINSAIASLKRGFQPLEGAEINTSFETIVRITRV